MARRPLALGLLCVCWVVVVGCNSTDLVANNCRINGQPCQDPMAGGVGGSGVESFDTLDLLFVVDNTPSMAATQADLAQQLPQMVRALTTGDVDFDGKLEFTPVVDIHFAVISTDMGASGITGLADCGDDTGRPLGDDALFMSNVSRAPLLGRPCEPTPDFLAFDAAIDEMERDQLFHGAGCLSLVGTAGCRHVMPLEAALKALWSKADGSVLFFSGVGHGVDAQPTFLRANALLGIIVVTDGDDCSSRDVSHFTPAEQLMPDDPLASIERNERCVRAADHLHPLSRYEREFGELKAGLLGRVFFGVIAGVPTDRAADVSSRLIPAQREIGYRALLDDPRMQQVIDPATPLGAREYTKVCGQAVPARRLAELAHRLDQHASLASICDSLVSPMAEMTSSLARLIDPTTTL